MKFTRNIFHYIAGASVVEKIKLELIASWADPLLSQISNGIPNLKLQERIYGLFHKNISNILFQIPIIKKRRGEWWFFRTNQFTNIGLVR